MRALFDDSFLTVYYTEYYVVLHYQCIDICVLVLTCSKYNMRMVDFRHRSTDLEVEHLGQTAGSLVCFHRPLSQTQLRTYF